MSSARPPRALTRWARCCRTFRAIGWSRCFTAEQALFGMGFALHFARIFDNCNKCARAWVGGRGRAPLADVYIYMCLYR